MVEVWFHAALHDADGAKKMEGKLCVRRGIVVLWVRTLVVAPRPVTGPKRVGHTHFES